MRVFDRYGRGLLCVACMAAILMLAAQPLRAAEPVELANADNGQWAVILNGFFPGLSKGGESRQLNCYLVRRQGKWAAALATATNNGRPNWNTALMPIDPDKAAYKDGKLTGTMAVTLVPDPWVPKDQKPRQATVTLDVAVRPGPVGGAAAKPDAVATISGKWSAAIAGDEAELKESGLQPRGEGTVTGTVGPNQPHDLADESYDLALYNLIPGQTKDNFQRRRALSLGVKGGKVVSARVGQMDMRRNAYDYDTVDAPEGFGVTPDALDGTVSFAADTLDGDRADFSLKLEGQRVSNFAVGRWRGSYAKADGKGQEISGFFRATVRPGAYEGQLTTDNRPWFTAVKDFKPPQAGEHPRLFFRKADVPELRRRAATPEGQQIVKRLRQLLNGSDGESMPTLYNPAKQAYEKNGFKPAPGAYSISSAAGFGFLYQLTGDGKYADLARQCVEKAFAGQRDFDDRYAWVGPGGELRAGPSVGWTAVAYDLCHDAWDDAFRRKVALAIQHYTDTTGGEWNQAEGITLRKMVLTPKQGPGSNHYGAVVGGCGLAVLAVYGDAGTDNELLSKYVVGVERGVVRHLSAGWGDGGYYKEGWGASHVGTQGGFLCFLQALKTAAGHDYLNVERPNASYITMVPRALMLLGPPAVYPYRSNMGPTYGSTEWHKERSGFSHGGHFAEGFGAVADKYKPGLLWVFNHIVEPDAAARDFDTPSLYPHRPMLALVNWPTFAGVNEANPGEVMPLVTRDRLYEYFVFRNRFRDKDDIVTTALIHLPEGTKPRGVMVWGMGARIELSEPPKGARVTHFQPERDGSGTVSAGGWALAVDYSGASGADALVVVVGGSGKERATSDKAKLTTLAAGKTTFTVLTLSRTGQHPEPRVDGDKLIVAGRTITYTDGRLTAAK